MPGNRVDVHGNDRPGLVAPGLDADPQVVDGTPHLDPGIGERLAAFAGDAERQLLGALESIMTAA